MKFLFPLSKVSRKEETVENH